MWEQKLLAVVPAFIQNFYAFQNFGGPTFDRFQYLFVLDKGIRKLISKGASTNRKLIKHVVK